MITHLATPEDLAGDRLVIAGDPYRHLFRARRLATGAELRVVDGRGRARRGVVRAITRRRAEIELGDELPSLEPARRVELIVALPRPERASWLVEKATEIGVTAVRFVASERAPRHLSSAARERLRRVAAAAVEQCGRARLLEISGLHPWSEIADLTATGTVRWLLAPGAAATAKPGPDGDRPAIVVIGPEGGLTAAEQDDLRAAGCVAVGLGERILRVETAALAAAALLFC